MALVLKNNQGVKKGLPFPDQKIHVARAAGTLPATAAQNLFQVLGGRVRVKGMLGEITTIVQAQATNLKVSSTAKDAAGATVGTAVDVASNVDCNALEVGGKVWVEGDGTALVKSNAGAAFIGTNSGEWIAPQGYISFTTGATSTGAAKWDLWYEPVDEGATVVAVPLASGV